MTQIQMPRPWEPNAEVSAYRNAVAQAVAAEAAGFSHFWTTEQHFFYEIGHSPCPDILLAAVSERTSRIRLGFAVMLMTVHNPFIVAEKVATLDVLSNGRVDFGMGRGSTSYMVEAFGVDAVSSREKSHEVTEAVLKMFSEEKFGGFKGKHYNLPERYVVPKPVQKPHPPLWIAASNLETYAHAARTGVGVIGVTRNSISETRSAIAEYRELIRGDRSGFIGAYPNEHVGVFALACVHDDDHIGRDIACSAARWYNGDNDAVLNKVRFGTAGGLEKVVAKFRARTNDELLEDGMAIGGNPDTVSRIVEKWKDAGVDQMIFVLQAGRTTHDQVMRSIELIGEKVIPRFAEAREAAE
jgi:alkanesulfonate monooxygenase SsuD/methylene tetrahydromethanopterin reductase-like flavin-dependent oxidoreductase (luciferase family)